MIATAKKTLESDTQHAKGDGSLLAKIVASKIIEYQAKDTFECTTSLGIQGMITAAEMYGAAGDIHAQAVTIAAVAKLWAEQGYFAEARTCCKQVLMLSKTLQKEREFTRLVCYILSIVCESEGETDLAMLARFKTIAGLPSGCEEFFVDCMLSILYSRDSRLSFVEPTSIKKQIETLTQNTKRVDLICPVLNSHAIVCGWKGDFEKTISVAEEAYLFARAAGSVRFQRHFAVYIYVICNRFRVKPEVGKKYGRILAQHYKKYMPPELDKQLTCDKFINAAGAKNWKLATRYAKKIEQLLPTLSIESTRIVTSRFYSQYLEHKGNAEGAMNLMNESLKHANSSLAKLTIYREMLRLLSTGKYTGNSRYQAYDLLERLLENGSLLDLLSQPVNAVHLEKVVSQFRVSFSEQQLRSMIVCQNLFLQKTEEQRELLHNTSQFSRTRYLHDLKHLLNVALLHLEDLRSGNKNNLSMNSLYGVLLDICGYNSRYSLIQPTVQSTLEDVVEVVAPLATDKNIEINLSSLPQQKIMLLSEHSTILRTLMFNVLFNAVEHSNPDSIVDISLFTHVDSYVLQVRNEFEGKVEMIEEKIRRGQHEASIVNNSAITSGFHSVRGLGLLIVGRLTNLLGGEVAVHRNNKNIIITLEVPFG